MNKLHGFGRVLHGAWLGLAFNEVAWLLGGFCMEHGLALHGAWLGLAFNEVAWFAWLGRINEE